MAKRLAMHVVAANPSYLNADAVPAEVVTREKEVARQTAIDSGKKPEVVEKMTEGRYVYTYTYTHTHTHTHIHIARKTACFWWF